MTDAICCARSSYSAAPPAPASSSRHSRLSLLFSCIISFTCFNVASQLRLHVVCQGCCARGPAALHDVQHRVHTAMVPDLQLELSISRCQVPDYSTSCVLRVNNVCMSVGCLHEPFNAAQGSHLLCVVRVKPATGFSTPPHDDSQQSPASSTFQQSVLSLLLSPPSSLLSLSSKKRRKDLFITGLFPARNLFFITVLN